jgi:hypothetical protein
MDAPGLCSPSRMVVSKMIKDSFIACLHLGARPPQWLGAATAGMDQQCPDAWATGRSVLQWGD